MKLSLMGNQSNGTRLPLSIPAMEIGGDPFLTANVCTQLQFLIAFTLQLYTTYN